jgi:hypothetical protein
MGNAAGVESLQNVTRKIKALSSCHDKAHRAQQTPIQTFWQGQSEAG